VDGLSERTMHVIYEGDARDMSLISDETIHVVVTSPPYAFLKRYEEHPEQLGHIDDYEAFLVELDKVWTECERVLVQGGRICCVVGDVCIPRRRGGRHYVLPLSADIQVRARSLGLDALTPIRWLKIANVALECSRSARYLGKPNLPNGVVKNDVEHILFLRKPGGYRKPTPEMEKASHISNEDYAKWFTPVWTDVKGASTRDHPAPFPTEVARRLIRMFSFAGDTALDPFAGTGSTTAAALETGRHSIGIEIEPKYLDLMERRLGQTTFGGEVSIVRKEATPPKPSRAAAA
jgi:site-specific DNA-methyltransferase (adenine-specific)